MRTLRPLGDKIIAKMIDRPGEKITAGGLIIQETDGTETAIRPRWFEITHVGPKQTEFTIGQFILVEHGRWTRGVDFFETGKQEDAVYHVDNNSILGTCDERPV